MKVLVLGASGATGSRLVRELLGREIPVRAVLRNSSVLPDDLLENPLFEGVRGNITEFTGDQIEGLLEGCDAAVSCLGHNVTFKGMFGRPRNLVSDTVKSVCSAIKRGSEKKKFILMSTTAYTTRGEKNSIGEKILFALIYMILPPHRDNMKAGNCLNRRFPEGDKMLDWTAVRPDGLIDSEKVSPYTVFETKQRSPMFDAGQSSRINVGHFMAELLTDQTLWEKWHLNMPVIYNS